MNRFLYLLLVAITSGPVIGQDGGDIRDVKDLVEVPDSPNYLLWAIIILLLIAAAVLFWIWRSRKPAQPGISAAKRALAQIQEAEALIAETDPDPFVLKVTDAIRDYIENRFQLAAPRRTTEEFLREIHAEGTPELTRFQDDLGEILKGCDAVKFGLAELASEDRNQLVTLARNFIEKTTHQSEKDD